MAKNYRSVVSKFVVLAGIVTCGSAQAGVVQLTSAASLSSGDTALGFPAAAGTIIAGRSVAFSAGNETVGFSNVTGNGFEIDQAGYTYGDTAYTSGTKLLGSGGYQGAGGLLTINFSQAVGEFGFNVEDFDYGAYTISFTAFDGSASLGTFTAGGCDNCGTGPSSLSFEGLAASSGTQITSIVVSDGGADNLVLGNFAFGLPGTGPVSVPEPSSLAVFAFGVAGLLAMNRRRSSGLPTG